jgi:hypothetical protein
MANETADTGTADVVGYIAQRRDRLAKEIGDLIARFENENGVTVCSVLVHHQDRQNQRPLLTSAQITVIIPEAGPIAEVEPWS